MSIKKIVIVISVIIAIAFGFLAIKYFSTNQKFNAKLSGLYLGNQSWSGTITLTGDTTIIGSVTVLPGTIVKFVVGDDQKAVDEVPADGFNDKDPTRLKLYTTTHTSLYVFNKLIAQGTPDKQIIFTSDAQKPDLADWEAVIFRGNGSTVDNVIAEYNRNGFNPTGKQPDSVIKNSVFRHTFWGGVSSAHSNIQIIGNQFSDNGHEGIDLKYNGGQVVKNNTISDCHTGIASIAGSQIIENNTITNCGDGVYIDPKSKAKRINNTFNSAPEDSTKNWRYGDYTIPIFDYPEI